MDEGTHNVITHLKRSPESMRDIPFGVSVVEENNWPVRMQSDIQAYTLERQERNAGAVSHEYPLDNSCLRLACSGRR